jgi:hypothetical protein
VVHGVGALHRARHRIRVADVTDDHLDGARIEQAAARVAYQGPDMRAPAEQVRYQVRADESGTAGHQDSAHM